MIFRIAIVMTLVLLIPITAFACYRFGQTSGFEMGFTQGMYSFAKTADAQRKIPNGDVVFKNDEWPDTLRGLGDLRDQSGAATFVPWKHNPSIIESAGTVPAK